MTAHKSVKARQQYCRLVGVITSLANLRLAKRLPEPPDFFEVRLDHLVQLANELEDKIEPLCAPLIITARHPAEGGVHNLPSARRRELLLRFLPRAQYVDVELRSVNALRSVLDAARRKNIRRIISFHHFGSTPSLRSLRAKARAAKLAGADIFKVATCTDTPQQLARLLEFVAGQNAGLPVSVMGMGRLGAVSRLALARCGSVLAYASLDDNAQVEGQISLKRLRAALAIAS